MNGSSEGYPKVPQIGGPSQDHEKCIEARAHLFKQGC